MRNTVRTAQKPFHRIRKVSLTASVLTLAGLALLAPSLHASDKKAAKPMTPVEEGKKLAFDKKKGNCLACHIIAGGDQAGNIGPPLVVMKARFPDKAVLHAQIADPRIKNPNTIMPPFGPHAILSEEELDKVVDFIHTL